MKTATDSRQWFTHLLQQGDNSAATEAHAWMKQAREHASSALHTLPLPNKKPKRTLKAAPKPQKNR